MKDSVVLRKELNTALVQLLDYWMNNAVDEEYGGFCNVSCWNEPMQGGEKSATLNCRILWAFANAYSIFGEKRYLQMAERAYRYIRDHFVDREYGGIYPLLKADGMPLSTDKQGYVHSYAVAAFAAYYQVTKDEESLCMAKDLFKQMESLGKNAFGGYHDVCARDWVPTGQHSEGERSAEDRDKSLRPNMHILWGYNQLRLVWDSPEVSRAIESLAVLLADKLVNHATWGAGQAFSGNWQIVSDRDAYGDDFELAWILWEALPSVKERDKLKEIESVCVRIVEHALSSGKDQEFGGIYQQFHHGRINTDKEWWVQAEAVNGLISAYEHTGEERYLDEAIQCWEFIRAKMANADGTWNWKTKRNGECYSSWELRGPLMCPYHSGRMLMQTLAALDKPAAKTA